jgi:hypothetical protein
MINLHNQRGEMKDYAKEPKNGFDMERMTCGQSYSNAN